MALGFGNNIAPGLGDWVDTRRQSLLGLASGILSSPTLSGGLANGFAGAAQGRVQDDAYATSKKEEAQRQDALNQTVKFLQNKGYDDLIPLVSAGQANVALQEAMKRSQPKDPATTADITNYEYAKTHPDFGGGDGGAYGGTSMDAQNANILLKGDVNSPEYAYAYNLATQPRTEFRETATGLVPIQITPTLPPGIRPPGGASGAQPSGPQLSQGPRVGMDNGLSPALGSPVQAGSPGVSTGAALPGTAPKPTEAQVRSATLTGNLLYDTPIILKNFDGLSDLMSRTAGQIPGVGQAFQTDEYKSAAQALGSGVTNIVYALSGAQAGDEEKRGLANSMTPTVFDGPNQIKEKKGRLVAYVKNIADASADPEKKRQAQAILDQLNASSASAGQPSLAGYKTKYGLD
jgi:hypothetical protein